MSNKLINAVIALVEDRSSDAREMLRSPELKISISEVQGRLGTAIVKRENAAAIKILKDVLNKTLRIDVEKSVGDANREAFIQGVSQVEEIIDNVISTLES